MRRSLQSIAILCSLLVLPATQTAHAQLQGSLFTTSQEREYLDVLRQNFLNERLSRGFDIEDSELLIPEISPPQADQPVTSNEPVFYSLGGIMSQGDGSHAIWLNNRALNENSLPRSVTLLNNDGNLVLQFNTPAGTRLLRPGQTLEFNSGTVMESYQRSSTSIPAPVAAPPANEAPTENRVATILPVEAETSEPETQNPAVMPPTNGNSEEALSNIPASIMNDPEALANFIELLNARRDRIDYGDEDDLP